LTDSDLEGQLDLLHNYLKAELDSSSGHDHSGTANQGKKISPANLLIDSQATGDTIYASSATAWARLPKGTANQVLKMKSDASNVEWGSAGGGVFKNLKVTRPSATTVTVTATSIGGLASVNFTCDITASGANGLDTGAEGNVWYYIYALDATHGLLSASATSPTLPGGYTEAILVSAVHNTAGDFVDFEQNGDDYWFVGLSGIASGNVGVGAWTTVDTTAYVPSGLSTLSYLTLCAYTDGIVGVTSISSVATGSTPAPNKFVCFAGTASATYGGNFVPLQIKTANTIYWLSGAANNKLYVSGFKVNKL
jgi:hypothetical protein